MGVKILTDQNFEEEVLNSEKKCLVDFYADWCGPCKMMAPVIEGIAEELGEAIDVGKVNSDENMELVEKYGIMSIPTIMIFENGTVKKSFVGVTSKSEILDALN